MKMKESKPVDVFQTSKCALQLDDVNRLQDRRNKISAMHKPTGQQ